MKNDKVQETREQATGESVERMRERPVYTPRTDIYETEDAVVLVADMPGVDEKSIEVTLERNTLTITGRTQDVVPEGYRRAYAEFDRGDYQRSFALSAHADPNGIQASMKDGVLRVSVPKAKPALKKIPVISGT
ncbi:MAG: Hsp20/alpha crystallin family protein [Planctomycetota bacterium]